MRTGALDIDAAYRRYAPMVFRRCIQLLRDEGQAEDCMQDVFVQLVRHRERLHGAALSSLLGRIATNLCLNRLRDGRARREDPAVDPQLAEIAAAGDVEAKTLAGRAVAWLFRRERERTRTMAVLHFVDGWTHEEIGRELGMTADGVRKHLRTLRVRLAAEGGR
ncbi:MAG TPA: sigma-70 family RNA polymerase sigma factor [Myxococcales bacterium]|nr:sigma-70 family RNA polymerase sigma factor [Myxococcales bacterium]